MWNQENEMPHVLVRFLRLCVGAKRQDSTKLASSVEPVNKASLDAPHREPQAQFTREEKLAEIRREIASRKTDYPGLVREQRMSQADADERAAIMEAIARDYELEPQTEAESEVKRVREILDMYDDEDE